MVALEHVNLKTDSAPEPEFGTFMGSEDWVDRHRDVLHLNSDSGYDAQYPEADCVIELLLCQAAAKAQDASLTRDFYHQLMNEPQRLETLRHKRLLICLGIVTIQAPLRSALESGFFGLLGDARVVLVDARDLKRKEQYRSFWEKNGLQSGVDHHPARFFDKFCQRIISHWVLARQKR